MATGAEPQPATLPLPGGSEGATVRVHPLLTGEADWSDAWPHRREGRLAALHALGFREKTYAIPIVAFLVEHPSAGAILIDTGLHPSVAVEPSKNLGRFVTMTTGRSLRTERSQAVSEQLRAKGIEPSQVKLVLMTHLHFDHASAMAEFPDSTFLISKREWETATAPQPWKKGYVPSHFDHAFEYRLLDFEGPDAESFSTFGRSFDLLGDGSVRAVYTPGHTPGHMSVVLRTGDREVVVVGDAAYTRRTLATGHKPFLMADEHRFARSLRELQLFAETATDALLIPGHDYEAWRALDEVYE